MINKEHYYNTLLIITMIDIYPPSGPEDPYAKIRVSEIEEKREKEKFENTQKKADPKEIFTWVIIQKIKKVLGRLSKNNQTSPTSSAVEMGELLQDILSFFQKLQNDDLSDDLDTITAFSQNWNLLCIEIHNLSKESEYFEEIHSLEKSVQKYCPLNEHTFGYYLSEFLESEWIPAPLIKIFQFLYGEHKKSPSSSQLSQWTSIIQKIQKTL